MRRTKVPCSNRCNINIWCEALEDEKLEHGVKKGKIVTLEAESRLVDIDDLPNGARTCQVLMEYGFNIQGWLSRKRGMLTICGTGLAR